MSITVKKAQGELHDIISGFTLAAAELTITAHHKLTISQELAYTITAKVSGYRHDLIGKTCVLVIGKAVRGEVELMAAGPQSSTSTTLTVRTVSPVWRERTWFEHL